MITILFLALSGATTVSVTVKADSGRMPISPYIYGKNNDLDTASLRIYNEAGLRLLRANGGNNATKYNWRNRLSSHPDWYNNVYDNDWDAAAKTIQTKLPGAQGMFAFQLLGWAAGNTRNNFDDWSYNQSSWWGTAGPNQNLAGGGTPNQDGGGKASVDGDATKYLVKWPADSTVGIVEHWFGPGGTGLDSTRFRYWNMDNEPDGWSGTHDDVVPAVTGHKLSAEEFVQRWAAVAKAVRRKFPGARLVGPASMSEWQWYTWENEGVTYKGKAMCFPEYLIKRLAEIQDSTGVRMIDVYDIHFYLNLADATPMAQSLQTHRFLYDTTYVNPAANGVKTVTGGWDESIRKEFIFLRLRRWLDQYFGKGNGIGVGSTESSITKTVSENAAATAVWHGSLLGTMADNGTELFTPWFWYPGMWEATHLFSRYAHSTRVKSVSDLDSLVSGYSSISDDGDSMTVVLVNRDANAAKSVSVKIQGFVPLGDATTLQLSGLKGETFVSHARNALVPGVATPNAGSIDLSLPALSVVAVRMAGKGDPVAGVQRHPNAPDRGELVQKGRVLLLSGAESGRLVLRAPDGSLVRSARLERGVATISVEHLPEGVYLAAWQGGSKRVFVGR
jgi:hypothetical protein